MNARLLRSRRGSPFARAKARPASRVAGPSYPRRALRDNFQAGPKAAALQLHYERENVSAGSAAKTVKHLFNGIDIKRWMALTVNGTQPNKLFASGPKFSECANNTG
jgi:hypothetical protein